jgi:uncharacterized protein YabE (DUF348 family)
VEAEAVAIAAEAAAEAVAEAMARVREDVDGQRAAVTTMAATVLVITMSSGVAGQASARSGVGGQ